MTSLDSTERPCAETKTHRGAITVICSDGVHIAVDLRLFPSEMLRRLAQSDFKDRNEIEILYSSATFLREYEACLPKFNDYFQMPQQAVQAPPKGISISKFLGHQCGPRCFNSFEILYRGQSFKIKIRGDIERSVWDISDVIKNGTIALFYVSMENTDTERIAGKSIGGYRFKDNTENRCVLSKKFSAYAAVSDEMKKIIKELYF